jgi:hypothetical protein
MIGTAATPVLHRRRNLVSVAVAVAVVALAIALPLLLLPGASRPPIRLLGIYGPRIVSEATGSRCHGAAASAASAVSVPVGPEAPQVPHGGFPTAGLNAVGPRLAKLFPDQFAGITLSNHDSTVNIYEVCSSPNMTRFVGLAVPLDAVRFLFVPNTWNQLNVAFVELRSGGTALQHQDVDLDSIGVDIPSNLVNVQVVNLTRRQLRQLGRVAPSDLLQVQGITRSQAGVPI